MLEVLEYSHVFLRWASRLLPERDSLELDRSRAGLRGLLLEYRPDEGCEERSLDGSRSRDLSLERSRERSRD